MTRIHALKVFLPSIAVALTGTELENLIEYFMSPILTLFTAQSVGQDYSILTRLIFQNFTKKHILKINQLEDMTKSR